MDTRPATTDVDPAVEADYFGEPVQRIFRGLTMHGYGS